MSFHRPPELPTELWTQILTYLSNDEIVRLKGLSRAFWHAALDISYGTLTLTPFKEVPKFPLPARLIWLFRLRKKARRFKQPHVAERVRTVHVVPNMEYTVWTLPGLFDHVQPKTTCQCLFLMFLFLCLWPIRWVIKHAVFIKPTFWLSLASSYELASTLAHLHSVQTLHLEEIIYSFICCGGIELYYHLKKPIPSFRSSLICCTLDTFAPTLLHLKLTIRSKGFDGFPCHFPALRSLEIVLYFRNASSFLPQIRTALYCPRLPVCPECFRDYFAV
ncbi:hypothetical protein DL96DRAFT_1571503 [Flagelloscypha sp. PMI_526]|nr:hypothetical protein DL96DRAFT_1571503 [Flagelloscypha sp. PMI_526]